MTVPTGLAAFNVGGVTIHRLLQLPTEHEGKMAGYWTLPKVSQKFMRNMLRHLKLLIVDEVSMLSSLNLAYIHLRLEEVFGGDTWFGSVNVLIVGDLLQLPPVNGRPVFEKVVRKAILANLGCMMSVNVWQETVTYDELTINEHQKLTGSTVTCWTKSDVAACPDCDPVARSAHAGQCSGPIWSTTSVWSITRASVSDMQVMRTVQHSNAYQVGIWYILSRFSVRMRLTRPPVQRSGPRKPQPNLTGSTRRTAT